MKRLLSRKYIDWEKYLGVKTSKNKKLEKELHEQINENGIYTIFDKSNSKKEMTNRLNERESESWKKAGIIIAGIGALIAIAKMLIGI